MGLKTLQERAQELQTAIHQNKKDSITPHINGFQQAHQNAQEKLKNLLEFLDPDTSKELVVLSAELDALDAGEIHDLNGFYEGLKLLREKEGDGGKRTHARFLRNCSLKTRRMMVKSFMPKNA